MLRTEYNISTLSFLIASFNEIIESFGENNKSVAFYKSQVDGMVNIGHVRREEARIIEEVVGMVNTDAIKWATAKQKIGQFIQAMNVVSSADSKNDVALLVKQMVQTNQISDSVADIIKKIFDISKSDATTSSSFGKFQNNDSSAVKSVSKPSSKTSNTDTKATGGAIHIGAGSRSSISKASSSTQKMQDKINEEALELFNKLDEDENTSDREQMNKIEKLKEACKKAVEVGKRMESLYKLPQYSALLMYVDHAPTLKSLISLAGYINNEDIVLSIRNLDAVCSCDPYRRKCEFYKVFDKEAIIDLLIRHADFKIGKEKEVGDSCHPVMEVINNEKAEKIIKSISWESVRKALKNWTRDINSMLLGE